MVRTTRAILLVAMLGVACAPTVTAPRVDLSGSMGGALLIISVANAYKPAYQATDLELALVPEGARRSDGFGEDPLKEFRKRLPPSRTEAERSATFVFLLSLGPGTYTLEDVRGAAARFPISGAFTVPIGSRVVIRSGRLTYLGHVDAVNRERRSDQERRAGPVIPLVDQATAGFSGGTFDVSIRAALAEDLAWVGDRLGSLPPGRIDTALVANTP